MARIAKSDSCLRLIKKLHGLTIIKMISFRS